MHMQCRCAWGSSWEDMYTSSPSTPSCARRVLYYRLRIRRPGGRGRRSMILRIPPFSEPALYTRQSHEGCAVSLYSRSSTHFGRMGTTRVGCKEPVNEGFNVGVPRLPPASLIGRPWHTNAIPEVMMRQRRIAGATTCRWMKLQTASEG